jgi:hypothetical protein
MNVDVSDLEIPRRWKMRWSGSMRRTMYLRSNRRIPNLTMKGSMEVSERESDRCPKRRKKSRTNKKSWMNKARRSRKSQVDIAFPNGFFSQIWNCSRARAGTAEQTAVK